MAKQNGPSGKLISTRTINSYLSGVAHLLEPYFPNVREARKNPLVVKTLRGAGKMVGRPVARKLPVEDHHFLALYLKLKKLGLFQQPPFSLPLLYHFPLSHSYI